MTLVSSLQILSFSAYYGMLKMKFFNTDAYHRTVLGNIDNFTSFLSSSEETIK